MSWGVHSSVTFFYGNGGGKFPGQSPQFNNVAAIFEYNFLRDLWTDSTGHEFSTVSKAASLGLFA